MKNQIEFVVYARFGLFTDPLTRVGGEKFTYQIPTYQALKGICESIYWKPTFIWIIDEVRVMNPIRTQSQGIRPINYHDDKNTLSYYTYLVEPKYEVKAHFEWNLNRPDLASDRNENKHYFVAKRMLERGGRRDVFLGTRECQGYVEPVNYGKEKGFYDHYGDLQFDRMFYGFDYPSDTGINQLTAKFWKPVMKNGRIDFQRDNNEIGTKYIKEMDFDILVTSGLQEEGLLDEYEEVSNELDSEII